ncbi:hypothetical protein AXF42_Ash017061 [Apostasia shenzhenica]|uniref:Uncharacterized protein n=1 Tax=Apostasia shenzhenica TaxID=1088818 RepID=A0A2I0B7J7_9ASPA|nr:hypothetical protein AXF42_Ash017061 [Apostasia shenzhenica]
MLSETRAKQGELSNEENTRRRRGLAINGNFRQKGPQNRRSSTAKRWMAGGDGHRRTARRPKEMAGIPEANWLRSGEEAAENRVEDAKIRTSKKPRHANVAFTPSNDLAAETATPTSRSRTPMANVPGLQTAPPCLSSPETAKDLELL